ncbi:gliding motility-associated C-terminal domain-containing protein [Pedobacter sp. Du54]|uniref:gliding motility-associated C-terminal domain-containing protein n=1 Tax=Pedobacter anseongensis TaxID=3133439 RepID=UPI0030B2EBD1
MKHIGVIFMFLFGFIAESVAENFRVTTNLDSGPGSLRAAIIAANLNPAGQIDSIFFNIPATQASDVTISLNIQLPDLTSDIVIDGTTQSGDFFNSSYIQIQLQRNASTFFNGLVLENVNNVQIYGIYFTNFIEASSSINDLRGAIYLRGSTNITIGAPGKGNAFTSNYAGIYAPLDPPHVLGNNILIQSNYFGLLPDGVKQMANKNGIDVSYMKNSKIGGSAANLGNVFGINDNISINTAGMSEAMLIANNTIGFDAAGSFIPNPTSIGISANGRDCTLTITDNLIGGQQKGIVLNEVNKSFFIKNNKVGTGLNGTEKYGNGIGIEINKCIGGIIGSNLSSEKNDIAYNTDGIVIIDSYPITITKNSLYCNTKFPIRHQNVDVSKITAPAVTSISAGGVSGKASPNTIIEVFSNHECSGCQGKIYLGSSQTQADGSFLYPGPISSAITLTGTNTDGATSAFTSPVLNDAAKQIVDEQCGSSNGSIKNIQVTDATTFRWFNSRNVQVANTRDLTNAKAGSYYLIAGQTGGCEVISPTYEIKKIDIAYKVKNATLTGSACGKTNGSIIVTSFETEIPTVFSWLDETDKVVSTDRNLIGAMPGTYRLFGDNGLGCKTLAGTFTIEPTTDLVVNTSKISILNTDCAKDEGSIVNVSITGGTAPLRYQWFDVNDQEVGTEADLLNVVSGTYYLKITDVKGCTVQSDIFTIPPSPFNAKIADTFSPNGDGINDVWRIPGLSGLSDFEIKIFNRQGNVVFHTKNQAKDFDGKYNNVDLPVGVYYYIIELKNNNCKGLNGSIMLIR